MLRLDVIGRVETSTGDAWPQARILVDDTGRAAVWAGGNGRVDLIWSGTAVAVESHAPPRTPWAAGPFAVTGHDGTVLAVAKGGCGCGTSLRVLGEQDLAKLGIPAATS